MQRPHKMIFFLFFFFFHKLKCEKKQARADLDIYTLFLSDLLGDGEQKKENLRPILLCYIHGSGASFPPLHGRK